MAAVESRTRQLLSIFSMPAPSEGEGIEDDALTMHLCQWCLPGTGAQVISPSGATEVLLFPAALLFQVIPLPPGNWVSLLCSKNTELPSPHYHRRPAVPSDTHLGIGSMWHLPPSLLKEEWSVTMGFFIWPPGKQSRIEAIYIYHTPDRCAL